VGIFSFSLTDAAAASLTRMRRRQSCLVTSLYQSVLYIAIRCRRVGAVMMQWGDDRRSQSSQRFRCTRDADTWLKALPQFHRQLAHEKSPRVIFHARAFHINQDSESIRAKKTRFRSIPSST